MDHWMEHLCKLLLAEEEATGAYLTLARQVGPKERGIFQRMAQEAQSSATCLKGIHLLTTGRTPTLGPIPPARGSLSGMLRRCYGQAIRSLRIYEALKDHPEYGPALGQLATQKQNHCQTLLELMGRLGSP